MGSVFRAMVVASLVLLSGNAVAQTTETMTNADVISLVRAKLADSTIVSAIGAAKKTSFDTTAAGLIALSKSGASDAVIQAMLNAGSPNRAGVAANGAAVARNGLNPEEVILTDGDQRTPMRYLTPHLRTAARGLGFGGVAQYAAMNGTKAAQRVSSHQPSFLLAVPSNAQPESYFTIANFAVRNNGTREVMIGGGYMSYSTGVNRDRVVAATSEKDADQSNAPPGFTMYRISPISPMNSGEYAIILYNSQVRVAGYFATGLDSYFDFGID